MHNVIININNCEHKRAIIVRLIMAQRKTAIKRVGPIITGAVRADKETLLYMTHSVFRPLLLPTFPVVIHIILRYYFCHQNHYMIIISFLMNVKFYSSKNIFTSSGSLIRKAENF